MSLLKTLLFALLCAPVALAAPSLAQPANPAQPAASSAPETAIPPRIPTATFAEIPALQGFKISPDGLHIAAHSDAAGTPRLAVITLGSKDPPLTIGLPEESELAWFRWAGPNRLLISVSTISYWAGDDIRATFLVSYDIRTKQVQFIGKKGEGLDGDTVIYVDPTGDWILLALQKSIYEYPSVYRVELETGKLKEIVKPEDQVYVWVADNVGVVRMGIGVVGKKFRIIYRKAESEPFRTIAKPRLDDENAMFDVLRIYQDSDQGYVLSNEKTGRYALYKFNLATRELGELIYEHPRNDIETFDTNDDGSKLIYAGYTDDRYKLHWFDQNMAGYQEEIDKGLKNRQNWMTSWSRDGNIIMVWTGDSNDPGRYYLYFPTEGKMIRYFVPHAALKPADLAKAEPVSYTARDGTEIPAYLTLPKGRDPKGLPLVILPHGGPFQVRDDLSFNIEVQMLANRGYAVLQPNFRGSGGYGKAFSDKGYGQWGRTMQDDLDDGMDWLVKRGMVDPKRVCIVGSSYGGYAAIWGAIRNPERYRCAASFAGVTDLKKQLKYDLDFFIARKYQQDWRDKVKGAEDFDMASVSPVQQAARLQVPLLIVHGEKDTNVPFKQAKWLVEALKKAGKPAEFHSYPEEGHGFDKPEDLKDWLDRLDAFLARNNPAS